MALSRAELGSNLNFLDPLLGTRCKLFDLFELQLSLL